VSNLDIHSEKRGEWHVVTVPAGIRVTVYSLPNRKAAIAARGAIAAGVPDFPWGVARDELKAAVGAFLKARGIPLGDAVTRALAAVPAADPHGFCTDYVKRMDAAKAEQAAYASREDADGYTEKVKPSGIEIGDEISFRYVVLGSRGIFGLRGFRGLTLGPREARTVTVRGTVTGEGRVMDRHGNNHGEFMDGLRFPLADAVWLGDDGATGPLTTSVTVDWIGRVRRRPRRG
jgi:hypothetical protein